MIRALHFTNMTNKLKSFMSWKITFNVSLGELVILRCALFVLSLRAKYNTIFLLVPIANASVRMRKEELWCKFGLITLIAQKMVGFQLSRYQKLFLILKATLI